MPPRMLFKPDASFFRKLALGAVGAAAVRSYLDGFGHNLVELERGSLDTRLWKDVKRKRVRIPDLVCARCGVRVESRAKTRAELSMSHSRNAAERSWDFGMVDADMIAFPICLGDEDMWSEGTLRGARSLWRERNLLNLRIDGRINMVGVPAFRGAPFHTKTAKGATEGSETQVAWPARFADAPGVVTAVGPARLVFRLDGQQKDRHVRIGGEVRACVAVGQRFERNELLASSVLPLDAVALRCRGECPADSVAQMVASRERTVRFAGCRLARLRDLQEVAGRVRELADDADEDPYVRLEARTYLCVVLGEDADRWFGEWATRHVDPQMRLEVVVALADTRTASSFALLTVILRDTAQPLFLRSASAWALGCHGTEDAAGVLVGAFADVELRIKEEALLALTQIGRASVKALVLGLGQDARDVAAGSAEVLRRLADVPIDDIMRLVEAEPVRAWPVWTLAHLPKTVVAPRIAAIQERRPEVHFAVSVLWSFLESWVGEHWTRRPLP